MKKPKKDIQTIKVMHVMALLGLPPCAMAALREAQRNEERQIQDEKFKGLFTQLKEGPEFVESGLPEITKDNIVSTVENLFKQAKNSRII